MIWHQKLNLEMPHKRKFDLNECEHFEIWSHLSQNVENYLNNFGKSP